jgi:hypothetical protein
MPRKVLEAGELFFDVADEQGWSKRKQVEILLGFIESLDLEAELEGYLGECTADDDTADSEEDPFTPEDE